MYIMILYIIHHDGVKSKEKNGKRGKRKMKLERQQNFGKYLNELRKNKDVTLAELAKSLNDMSLSFLSDIERGRRKPLDKDKIEIAAKRLLLTDTEKANLYDLAAQWNDSTPEDVTDAVMYLEQSPFVRLALRKTMTGEFTKEDWENFINSKGGSKT